MEASFAENFFSWAHHVTSENVSRFFENIWNWFFCNRHEVIRAERQNNRQC